jgi:hypothetical protein
VVVDFSDNSLFAAVAIDIPGNNLFAGIVLGGVAAFFNYASRIFAWGERNKVQNFVNMGFDGGYDPRFPSLPLGWTLTGDGYIQNANLGWCWRFIGTGAAGKESLISQSAYQDAYGVEIIKPNTQYRLRIWCRTSAPNAVGNLVASINDPGGAGDLITATIPLSSFSVLGNYVEVEFSGLTPSSFFPDIQLQLFTEGQLLGQYAEADEVEIIYSENPYRLPARASYVNAPEQFDGVTGDIGPATDITPIRALDVLRDTLYFYTANGIHSTNDNADAEPSGWVMNQFANAVGILSLFSEDRGEEWHMIATRSGPRIFDGSGPFKIGQEIQSEWEQINWAAQKTIWVQTTSLIAGAISVFHLVAR